MEHQSITRLHLDIHQRHTREDLLDANNIGTGLVTAQIANTYTAKGIAGASMIRRSSTADRTSVVRQMRSQGALVRKTGSATTLAPTLMGGV